METPALIVDNFFENPDEVRLHALAQRTYEPHDFYVPGMYSGYRSLLNDPLLEGELQLKLERVMGKNIDKLYPRFHLNPESSVCGCPHLDNIGVGGQGIMFAGVIYLTPNPPKNSGTTLYEHKDENIYVEDYTWKMQVVYDISLPPTNVVKQKLAQEMRDYKEQLTIIQKCENVYNRLLLYPAHIYHSPDEYFGRTLDDGRLTISIHGTFAP